MEHYSTMKRPCVFSHDELVCRMASESESLSLQAVLHCNEDMKTMVDTEIQQRERLLAGGVAVMERKIFEQLPKVERQCAVCKTTCFLSALTNINVKVGLSLSQC